MREIYLLHTQFNIVYSDLISNGDLKFKRDRIENKHKGFGGDKSIALLFYDENDGLKVTFDDSCTNIEITTQKAIVLVSDELYGQNHEQVKIILKTLLKDDCKIHPFYHQRPSFEGFLDYFNNNYKEKIVASKNSKYSHISQSDDPHNWKNKNPFYKLVEIVNAENIYDFEKCINELDSIITKVDLELESILKPFALISPFATAEDKFIVEGQEIKVEQAYNEVQKYLTKL